MARRRLDTLLTERGLATSRARAAESVRAGLVTVGRGGERPTKPSQLVAEDAELQLVERQRYVSRGGIKLENALRALGLDVAGRDAIDVGASTGGFTDCLLQHGCARVIALDVAHGQLDWGLRNDDRVTVLERANARHLRADQLPWAPSIATVDVSFISLSKVLPAVVSCLDRGGDLLALVKPQFELGPQRVGKGGVVRDPGARREAILSAAALAPKLGRSVLGIASSGLPGPKGNRETFVWLGHGEPVAGLDGLVEEAAR